MKEVNTAYSSVHSLIKKDFNDTDASLLLSESLDPYSSLKSSLKAVDELGRHIKPRFEFNVKILNNSPIKLHFEVIKKGHIIFSRDESSRIDFESEVIPACLDLKYMYDLMDKEFLEWS
ncbi:MAG: nucleotidyltransferase domain-containing protein [Methanosarcina mazei]|uniref:nucleotidyltransferase domain-containing protein n=1 Tax=Methanosarcina soligelidi TaxID=1036677 RepID=UPI000B335624|nr:nucleotidyltransferase domain-containing protein [Methanosarcina soligelidi]